VSDVTSTRPKRVGKYLLGKILGQGASGVVRVGKNTATGEAISWGRAPVGWWQGAGGGGVRAPVGWAGWARTRQRVGQAAGLPPAVSALLGSSHAGALLCHADELVAIKMVDASRFKSITEIEQASSAPAGHLAMPDGLLRSVCTPPHDSWARTALQRLPSSSLCAMPRPLPDWDVPWRRSTSMGSRRCAAPPRPR
jgi:hypothetical protein